MPHPDQQLCKDFLELIPHAITTGGTWNERVSIMEKDLAQAITAWDTDLREQIRALEEKVRDHS